MHSRDLFLTSAALALMIAICALYLYTRGEWFTQANVASEITPTACFANVPSIASSVAVNEIAGFDEATRLTWSNVITNTWPTRTLTANTTAMQTNTLPVASCMSDS